MFFCSLLTFESDYFARRVHDRRISRYGSSNGIRRIIHVYYYDLRRVANLFSHAYEFVRFHGESVEADIARIDPHSG